MYGPAAADAGQAARRAIVLAASEEFGLYAARSSSPGVRPLSVSAPRPTRNGTVVVTNFEVTGDRERTGEAPECLVTLKPAVSGRQGPARLASFLAAELSPFGRRQLMAEGEAQLAAALDRASAEPAVIRIDGSAVQGWALRAAGVSGVVAMFGNLVVMWLGAGEATPPAIFTEDLAAHLRELHKPIS